MNFKNMWSASEQKPAEAGGDGAQQSFKEDCDINVIMNRFAKTGTVDHVKKHQPRYGIATGQSLHEAMNLIAQAESMFMDLDPDIRNKFNGSPSELLDFVQNPDNELAAAELGLALSDEAQAVADARKAAIEAPGSAEVPVEPTSPPGAGGGQEVPLP